jgi:hypothetical protein
LRARCGPVRGAAAARRGQSYDHARPGGREEDDESACTPHCALTVLANGDVVACAGEADVRDRRRNHCSAPLATGR